MKYQALFLIILFIGVVSCKSINPDKPSFKGDPVSLPTARSSINLPLEIPLSYLESQLNGGLSELLYAEKGLPVGNGLSTDIQVFRTGDIKLSSNGKNSLRIKLPLRLEGNLMFKKKLFGQMVSTAIPYDETLVPDISFTPEIGKNWELNLNNIKIEGWGRSISYELLGYEVDFDPLIRKQIENILNKQLNAGGNSVISFKNLISKTWEAFGKPFKISHGDMDLFIYTIPHEIKVNKQITSDQKLKLNIGLKGKVFTQLGEKPDFNPGPLPSLSPNKDTVSRLDITLPLAVSYTSLDLFLNQELVNKPLKLEGNNLLIPEQIHTQSFGDRALVKMKFTLKRPSKKALKGELYLVGKPSYDRTMQAVVFEDIDFELNTKNILARSAGWLKQGQILEAVKKHAVYPIGGYIEGARRELQHLGHISTEYADFRLVNPELEVRDIYVTTDDIRIYLHAVGELEMRL